MGNASGKEEDGRRDDQSPMGRSGGDSTTRLHERAPSADFMSNTPPGSPARHPSPVLFAPQIPLAPMQRGDAASNPNQIFWNQSQRVSNDPPEQGIPAIITWSYGGNDVAVEGSWDNWTSRRKLQRSGKDHSILLVLLSGIYHYKFIVDGERRYVPDFPSVSDESGNVCNILDVHNYVPENPESISEFEAPASPESSYSQAFPTAEDLTKEPLAVPNQLHLTVLDSDNQEAPTSSSSSAPSSSKPQHVVLNHVFIERGWAPQSVVALGLTHRFESKYITVVLYKPLRR